jgi:imidazolonepropionase-like amidohydrolase
MMNALSRGVVLCVLGATAIAGGRQSPPERQLFRNVRLVDGDGRLVGERLALLVERGRVAAVDVENRTRDDAAIVDLQGRTMIPGLVNAHGHVADTLGLQTGRQFYTEANVLMQLAQYASYGVTTVMSLGGDGEAGFEIRRRQRAGTDASGGASSPDRATARLFVAGPVITAVTPEAAAREVERVAAMKPDMLKIRVDDNLGATAKMPLEAATAVIREGHARGLRVAAHVFYLDDAKALLRAGADFIAHSIRDQPVDEELIQLLKSRNVCVCPTLMREVSTFVYGSEPDFFSDPFFLRSVEASVLTALRDPKRQEQVRNSSSAQRYKAGLEIAMANVKRLADAGVPIALGTDSGPPGRFQGYFEHLELELMTKAGMEPGAVLSSATGAAAGCLAGPKIESDAPLRRVGYLRPGYWADFIVLKGDPLADVRNTRTIESVWIAGRRVGN